MTARQSLTTTTGWIEPLDIQDEHRLSPGQVFYNAVWRQGTDPEIQLVNTYQVA